MAKSKGSLVAWIAPSQSSLLLEVAKEAKLKLIAVGSSNLNESNEIAGELGVEGCHDIRSMASQFDDAVMWIAQSNAYDISLCPLLRQRAAATVTSTPLNGTLDQLVQEAGQLPAASFIPLMRRSCGFGEASDDIEQFGQPSAIHCTMLCSKSEGSLGARLFDAMDYIDNLLGTPEGIHAFHIGTHIPDEASELQGQMTVNMQFQHQRCATLLLSDQAEWKRETQMIGINHTIIVGDGDTSFATLIADGIASATIPEGMQTVADAPRILALCESARLSCLTGSIEQPHRVSEMFGN